MTRGNAWEIIRRRTGQDFDAVAACYSENAVAVTPDQEEVRGREAIIEYSSDRRSVP